jgi:hypothetical protein
LYRAAAARSDEHVRAYFPRLSFPSLVRLIVRGGVRSGRRNTYFRFGAPALVIEGALSETRVCCNGVELQPEDGLYRLPATLPAGRPISVEIRSSGKVLRRQTFSLIDDFEWRWTGAAHLFDRFGAPVDMSQAKPAGVAGASLVGVPPPPAFFSPPSECFAARRVFFVGSLPGQIVSWPAEELPTGWTPVWAIPMGRKGRAIYCGLALDSATASESVPASICRRKVREWKDVLSHRQQRIAPPSGGKVRQLWKQYQEVASRVRA